MEDHHIDCSETQSDEEYAMLKDIARHRILEELAHGERLYQLARQNLIKQLHETIGITTDDHL